MPSETPLTDELNRAPSADYQQMRELCWKLEKSRNKWRELATELHSLAEWKCGKDSDSVWLKECTAKLDKLREEENE